MRRSTRGHRAILVAAAMWVIGLSIPLAASACTCAPDVPGRIGTFGDVPSIVVFVGTITSVEAEPDNRGRQVGTMTIDRVFKGELAAEVQVVGGSSGACLIRLEPLRSMITAATLDAGVLEPNVCMPGADPASAVGRQLIDDATAAYGPGRAPPHATPDTIHPSPLASPDPFAETIKISVLAALAIVLLGALAVLRRRRRRGSRT